MDLAHLPQYTLEDWARWEGDWELIEGLPYAMVPSPSVTHQAVGARLVRRLGEALDACPDCLVLYETDWEVSNDTVLRPDCLVVCDQRGERIRRPPRMLFEIVSMSSAARDERLKFEIAEREGVPYYVLIYPERRIAKIFRWREGRFVKAGDCSEESFDFRLGACHPSLDFSRIWPPAQGT